MRSDLRFSLLLAALACLTTRPVLASGAGSHSLISQAMASRPPITIAVREITNDVGNVWWWSPNVARRLTAMLTNELQSTGHFTVVERVGLGKVLDEQALAEAGIVRKKTAPKKGMVTGARYYVLGSISDYQENVETKGGKNSFSVFGIGQAKSKAEQKAYVAVDIRVVDTTSGEVAYSRTIEGLATAVQESKSTAGCFMGVCGADAQDSSSKPPASKAVRSAMIEVSNYLDCFLYRKGSPSFPDQRRSGVLNDDSSTWITSKENPLAKPWSPDSRGWCYSNTAHAGLCRPGCFSQSRSCQ
jgi:curli biogenesis system outer membrane secretion channel CsgG